MPACSVSGCNRTLGIHTLEDDGSTPLNFFTPRGLAKPLLEEWLKLCRKSDLTVENCSNLRICSRHFVASDITGNRLTRPRLKKDAVPSRNLPPASEAKRVKETSIPCRAANKLKKVKAEKPIVEECAEVVVKEVCIHPTKRVTELLEPWNYSTSNDITWYYHVVIGNNDVPQLTKSVKVTHNGSPPKFYIGRELIEKYKSDALLRNRNINNEDEFIQMLEAFCQMPNETDPFKSAVSMLQSVLDQYENIDENMEETQENPDSRDIRNDQLFLRFMIEQMQMHEVHPNSRRFSADSVKWANGIHLLSPAAYKYIYNSGFLVLPCERTLIKHKMAEAVKTECIIEYIQETI